MSPKPASRPKASVEATLVLAILDLANHLYRRGEAMAAAAGLSAQQWIVLLHIAGDANFPGAAARAAGGGVRPSEIAAARGVSRATISAAVASLVRAGLVRQVAHEEDRRSQRLRLTSAGERALATIEPLRRRGNRKLLAGLDERQRRALLDGVEACLRALGVSRGAGADVPEEE
jgi:DNA-binding MarR family transcriptional regulator